MRPKLVRRLRWLASWLGLAVHCGHLGSLWGSGNHLTKRFRPFLTVPVSSRFVLAMQKVEDSSPFIRLAFTAFLASGGHGRAPIVPQTTTQTLWLVGSLAAPLPCVAPCGADSDGAGVD